VAGEMAAQADCEDLEFVMGHCVASPNGVVSLWLGSKQNVANCQWEFVLFVGKLGSNRVFTGRPI
jgi:hypothetical protein